MKSVIKNLSIKNLVYTTLMYQGDCVNLQLVNKYYE